MIRMMGLVNLQAIGNTPVGSRTVYEEELKGDQKKLDVDNDGKIEGEDLAKLRAKKMDEEEYDSGRDAFAAGQRKGKPDTGFAYTPIKQRRGEDRAAAVRRAHAEDERRKAAIQRASQKLATMQKNPQTPQGSTTGNKDAVLNQTVKYPGTDGKEHEATVKSLLKYPPDHPGRKIAARMYAQFMATQRQQKEEINEENMDNPRPSNDHEVSMANNALDTIIQHANTLKEKLGQEEKDIPAWIQDHISNAANFIQQAANNYHEYNTPDEPMEEGNHLNPADDHKDPHKDPHLAYEEICEGCDDMYEVAPEGWEGTVKAMKKYKKIDNPWALAYYMKSKGYKAHKKDK